MFNTNCFVFLKSVITILGEGVMSKVETELKNIYVNFPKFWVTYEDDMFAAVAKGFNTKVFI